MEASELDCDPQDFADAALEGTELVEDLEEEVATCAEEKSTENELKTILDQIQETAEQEQTWEKYGDDTEPEIRAVDARAAGVDAKLPDADLLHKLTENDPDDPSRKDPFSGSCPRTLTEALPFSAIQRI